MAHDYKCTELRAIAISHKPLAISHQLCNIPTVTGRLCTLIVVAFTLFVPTAGHGGGPVDLRAQRAGFEQRWIERGADAFTGELGGRVVTPNKR
jgi:hypothetical protein